MTVLLPAFAFIAIILALYLAIRIARDPLFGVCVFVFLSSITMMPELPLVSDRLAVADFVMLYTLAIFGLKGQLVGPAPNRLKFVDGLALLFISAIILGSMITAMIGDVDVTRVFLFLLIYVYGYMCFRMIIRLVRDRQSLQRVLIWWAGGAALVIIVGFLAGTGIYRPEWTIDPNINRVSATFKGSGQVASYLGPAMFLLFYLATSWRLSIPYRMISVAMIFAGSYVLLHAGSRIAFVIMIVSVSVGTWIILSSRLRGLRRLPLILSTALASAVFSLFVISVWNDTSSEYGLLTTSPVERAVKIWSEQARSDAGVEALGGTRYDEISMVLDKFEYHPILGIGSGMFSETYRINEVHNTYFGILAENGLLGFVFFLMWWIAIFFAIYRSMDLAKGESQLIIKFAFWAFLVLSIYQVTTNGMRQRPFWFIPALALSTASILSRPMSSSRGGANAVAQKRRKTLNGSGDGSLVI